MAQDRFEDIQEGDTAEVTHMIVEADLETFVRLTGDDNPLHVDPQYAQRTQYGDRIVHGMLAASFISTVIGTRLPGPGALWFEQHLRFAAPTRVGDTIRVVARVKHKSDALRVLVLDTTVYNQMDETLIEGEAKVKVLPPVE